MQAQDRGKRARLLRRSATYRTFIGGVCRSVVSKSRLSLTPTRHAARFKQRLDFDPLVEVRTIHSFAWSLLEGFDNDIREWVVANLLTEITDLEEAQAKGRAGTKAAADRERSIESKRKRHASLSDIQRFIYSPTGDNRTRDSLSHSEVIAINSEFLTTKSTYQQLLIARYPVLLIDESQDSNRLFMDAVLHVQAKHRAAFCVGLFGDPMQRIYGDGKIGLADAIPEDWARPEKRMNHPLPNASYPTHQQYPRRRRRPGAARPFGQARGVCQVVHSSRGYR